MSDLIQHICVCICTYKRPVLLRRLLEGLGDQDTSRLFTFSIVVVDNDRSESARGVVKDFTAASHSGNLRCGAETEYRVGPKQGR